MRHMTGVAPPTRTVADRLTAGIAGLDHRTNTVHDALNRAVPWLWWPLTVPDADRRLAAREHALYAAHAGIGVAVACLLQSRRRRTLMIGSAAAVISWAIFTGAWDRRADQSDSCDRRAL